MHRVVLALFLLSLSALAAGAQTKTVVSGTITDPNGIPYSFGSIATELIPSTASPTVNGVPINGFNPPSALDANGHFSISLFCNAAGGGCSPIAPSGTKWLFTITNPGAQPPAGFGAVSFQVSITITGATQDVSSTLSAAAPQVLRVTAAGGPPSGAAGGDLSGTFPNPGVDGINGASIPLSAMSTLLLGTNSSGQLISVAGPEYVISTLTPGAHWTDKVVTAYSSGFCSANCTIVVPDSVADNGSATTPSLPDSVNLRFPGTATFTFCRLQTGAFSKVYASGALLQESGANCLGLNPWTNNSPTQQSSDHPVFNGVRINCNGQTASTGITFSNPVSGGGAGFDMENVEVTGCSDSNSTGIKGVGAMQFSHWRNVHLQQNYVALKAYVPGGWSSNIFDGLQMASCGSGVCGIIVNNSSSQDDSGNLFFNLQCQNGTIACLALIGTAGSNPPELTILGTQPELNGGGAASITIDGNVIPQSGFMYLSNAAATVINAQLADASANPDFKLANCSHLTLQNIAGFGAQFNHVTDADNCSSIAFAGPLSTNGVYNNNIINYPSSLTGSRGGMAGSPISRLDSGVPNFFTGNVITPAFSSTTGTIANGTAVDPVYGTVQTVTFAASPGNAASNEITILNIIPSGATAVASSYFFSTLVKASVDTNVNLFCHFSGGDVGFKFGASTLQLYGGQWTRVIGYNYNIGAGLECDLQSFPNDSAGATLSFTRIESLAYPTAADGHSNSLIGSNTIAQVLGSGAVNPNGNQPVVASTLQSTVATGTPPLTVASTTNVANLNASSLSGATFAAPGAIGGTTPASGSFTTLTLTGQTLWPVGSVGTPSQGFTTDTNTGWFDLANHQPVLAIGGVGSLRFNGQSAAFFSSSACVGWASGADTSLNNPDTSLCRPSADTITFGNGSANNTSAKLRAALYSADGGTVCTNGELVLSAGWGNTATVTTVVGTGQTCEWTITSSGTGQAANPTITDTLTNTLPAATTVCEMRMVGGTGTTTLIDQTTLSTTAPVFTFGGTPVAASTYKVVRRCGP